MLGHTKSKEHLAFGYLYGQYITQNVTKAQELFDELAMEGSPRGQMVSFRGRLRIYCFKI